MASFAHLGGCELCGNDLSRSHGTVMWTCADCSCFLLGVCPDHVSIAFSRVPPFVFPWLLYCVQCYNSHKANA